MASHDLKVSKCRARLREEMEPDGKSQRSTATYPYSQVHLRTVCRQQFPCHFAKGQDRLIPGLPICVAIDPEVVSYPMIPIEYIEIIQHVRLPIGD